MNADELVFYSLKERLSKGGATLELPTVKLAKLLYCALYRCQVLIYFSGVFLQIGFQCNLGLFSVVGFFIYFPFRNSF